MKPSGGEREKEKKKLQRNERESRKRFDTPGPGNQCHSLMHWNVANCSDKLLIMTVQL
jgi:hypothetical protein